MAARVRLLQVAITAVNLVIVGLAFTSIWPFPSGDFKIDLPSPEEVAWTYDQGILTVSAPFTIDNGGFYDVRNLSIHYRVSNYESMIIAEQDFLVGTIAAGRVVSSSLDFTFNLIEMYNAGLTDMVFSDDLLSFSIDVHCLYTMNLVGFDAAYRVDVPWEALVKGYGIDWGASSLPPNSPPYSIVFWLDTARLLESVPPAQIALTVLGATSGPLATGTTTIVLGGNHSSPVVFDTTALAGYTSVSAIQYEVNAGGFRWSGTINVPGGS